jgi:hypothetical protein
MFASRRTPPHGADVTTRYAIYDPRTDRDLGEFADLPEAYVEIDRLTRFHGLVYGVRIARAHRAEVERNSESRRARPTT